MDEAKSMATMKITKKNPNYPKTLVIPLTKQMWSSLRQISFDHQISMAELTRAALQKVINKYQPDIDINE